MTITTQTLRSDYTANGVNTSFAFNFPIFFESNANPKFSLQVITTDANGVETIKTETTDYAITYSTIENGVIASGNVVFGTAPTNGHKVSILRKVNLTQNAEFTNKGTDKFSGSAIEAALDKLTLLALQTQENLNRVVKLPKSSQLTNIEFPISASQANQVITVNNAGDNLTTKDLADVGLAPVSTFAKTLLDDTTASQARTTLDAQQLNANLTALASLPSYKATTTTQGITFLSNPITISNNATTPNTDIDFTAGVFQFSDGSSQAASTAMTKRLQSSGSWSAGNSGNMLLTGARANSSTYHLFALFNPTTGAVDYGALLGVAGTTPDPTASLPSGYTKFALIASLLTDASGNIRTGRYFFRPNGTYVFKYNTTVVDIPNTTTPSSSSALQAVAVPLGLNVGTYSALYLEQTSGGTSTNNFITVQDFNKTTISAYALGVVKVSSYTNVGYAKPSPVLSNTSGQIWLGLSSAGTGSTYQLSTDGWETLS